MPRGMTYELLILEETHVLLCSCAIIRGKSNNCLTDYGRQIGRVPRTIL